MPVHVIERPIGKPTTTETNIRLAPVVGEAHIELKAAAAATLNIIRYYNDTTLKWQHGTSNADNTFWLDGYSSIGTKINYLLAAPDDNYLQLDSNNVGIKLRLGSDTNLYRSAANTLKTDDSLVVVGALDVSNGSIALTIGADSGLSTRTDVTTKIGRYGLAHYTNAEEPAALLYGTSDVTDNSVFIGGGTSIMNSATQILFYTAATNTTVTGSRRMTINSSGQIALGSTDPVTDAEVNSITGGILTLRRFDTSIAANDVIGALQWYAADTSTTTTFVNAKIEVQATNSISTDINPTRMIFSTTPATVAGVLTEAMRIDNAQNVLIGITTGTTNKLSVYKTTTNATGNIALMDADFYTTATGDWFNKALSGTAWAYGDVGTTNTGYLMGLHFAAMNNGDATQDDIRGLNIQYGNYVSATAASTQVVGVYLSPYLSAGTIGTLYHIYMGNKTSGGTVTGNEWSIYSLPTTAHMYHAGNVAIGDYSIAASELDVNSTTGGILTIRRYDTSVTANDMVGKIQFYAMDSSSTTNNIVADIEAQATNTVSTNINPGRLIFRTTSAAVAATPTERMRVTENGDVGINNTSPTEKLTVQGRIKADEYIGDGNRLQNIRDLAYPRYTYSAQAPLNPRVGDVWVDIA